MVTGRDLRERLFVEVVSVADDSPVNVQKMSTKWSYDRDMRKRGRVTYLVLLAVGAIEDHMAAPAGRAPQERGGGPSERSLAPTVRPVPQGGLIR
jgi:hypothetical protein